MVDEESWKAIVDVDGLYRTYLTKCAHSKNEHLITKGLNDTHSAKIK